MNINRKRRMNRVLLGLVATFPVLQGLSCLTDLIPF